jgi:hypothetical protein
MNKKNVSFRGNVLQSLLEEFQDLSETMECKEVIVQWREELAEIR